MNIVVAITGASGALYSQRLLHGLAAAGVQIHLVISPLGERLLMDELSLRKSDLDELTGGRAVQVTSYAISDVGSRLASGSFLHDGMVICPCSSNTLGEVSAGIGDNLIARAAAVTLKERRKLVVVHREMPLSLIDIENYRRLTLAGAIMAPANPGWYLHPKSPVEIADFVAGKVLDLLGIPHNLIGRWDAPK
jgi:4-hydroxy-3-polyprenylbenzoate decarboxylase